MKSQIIKYSFFLLTFSLVSCGDSSQQVESINKIGVVNLWSNYEFQNDTNYSLACNICLLEDSIQKIRTLISKRDSVILVDGKYKNKKATFDQVKDLLVYKIELSKALNAHQEKYGKSSIFDAKEECISEFGYFNIERQGKRDTLLLTYDLYSLSYVNLPTFNADFDTSQIPHNVQGDYIMLITGDTILVPAGQYQNYIDRTLVKYNNAWNYVNQKRAALIMELTGLDFSKMSAMEKMIVEIQLSETRGRIHIFHPTQQDTTLDRLREELNQSFYY